MSLFKLYLTGIETLYGHDGDGNVFTSSNCTLLELKLTIGKSFPLIIHTFKLSLTGIETTRGHNGSTCLIGSNCT